MISGDGWAKEKQNHPVFSRKVTKCGGKGKNKPSDKKQENLRFLKKEYSGSLQSKLICSSVHKPA